MAGRTDARRANRTACSMPLHPPCCSLLRRISSGTVPKHGNPSKAVSSTPAIAERSGSRSSCRWGLAPMRQWMWACVVRDPPCLRNLAGTVPGGSSVQMQATSEHTPAWRLAPCRARDVESGSPLLGRSAAECRLKPRRNIIPSRQYVVDIVARGYKRSGIREFAQPPFCCFLTVVIGIKGQKDTPCRR
jgi:hypothetical protein